MTRLKLFLVVGMFALISAHFGASKANAEFEFGYSSYGGYGGSSYGGYGASSYGGYGSYGYDAAWGGMYGAGGSNLYGFGTDLYNLGSFYDSSSLYGNNWGGSCGSFSSSGSCYGGWDSGSYLSGYDYDININIELPIFYGYQNYGQSNCFQYPTCYQPSCSQNPQFPTYPTYPTTLTNYNPLLPNPWDQGPVVNYPSYPPTAPPWGGCGGVVQCPTGPTTPTQAPIFNYSDQTVLGTPTRYDIPRSVH